ncbi:MAG: LysE/ArgO family amino acid transporter [Rhodospirillales bacterium]|nr:LysE/ArgO family amino acid transporter [Rhodospirillales bacterium]
MLILTALKGFGLGAGLIIAIGAQNAYVLRQGILGQHVFIICTICAVSDMALIAIGAMGLGTVIANQPMLADIATWGGAIFLLWLSFQSFRNAAKPHVLKEGEGAAGLTLKAAVTTTLALTFLNPHVYLDTVVLIGTIVGQYAFEQRIAFTIGAMTASIVWFYSLGYGARLLRPLFAKPTTWRWLDIIIGCIMAAIAISLIKHVL